MATPIVIVALGGLPITEAANGYGMPVSIATNGYGTPCTIVASGGMPVVGSGGVAALAFLRVVTAANSYYNAQGLGASGTKNTFVFNVPIEIAQDAARIVLSFNAWGSTISGDANVGNDLTILDAAIDTGSALSQVFFSASAGATVTNGAIDFQADPVSPPAGRKKFSRGEIYYLKLKMSVPATTGKMPYTGNGSGASVANWQSFLYDPAVTTASNTLTPGPYTFTGTAPNTNVAAYQPFVLGYPYIDQISVIAVGDSEISALTDTGFATLINGNGYFQRSLTDSDGVSNPRSAMNFSVPGAGSNVWIPTLGGSGVNWLNYIKYANTGFNGLGTNDMPTFNFFGETSAQQAVVQFIRQGGVKRIMRPELFPNTTSSDSFATVVNQTPQSGWGPGAEASQIISWFPTKLNDGIFQGIMSAAVARDAGTPTNWTATGAAFFATPDGKHPSTAMHASLGTSLRTAWSTFPTSDPVPSVLPPVLNPFDCHTNITLSGGNLTATNSTGATQCGVRATTPVRGSEVKYLEYFIVNATNVGILICQLGGDLSTANNVNMLTYNSNGGVFFNGQLANLPAFATGQTVCLRISKAGGNQRLSARLNGGNWNGNVANDPDVAFIDLSGTNKFSAVTDIYPGVGLPSLNGSVTVAFSGFAFAVPAGASAITGGGV